MDPFDFELSEPEIAFWKTAKSFSAFDFACIYLGASPLKMKEGAVAFYGFDDLTDELQKLLQSFSGKKGSFSKGIIQKFLNGSTILLRQRGLIISSDARSIFAPRSAASENRGAHFEKKRIELCQAVYVEINSGRVPRENLKSAAKLANFVFENARRLKIEVGNHDWVKRVLSTSPQIRPLLRR